VLVYHIVAYLGVLVVYVEKSLLVWNRLYAAVMVKRRHITIIKIYS
jgi:hypothetical protein